MVRFTIESRELRRQHARQRAADAGPRQVTIEASTADDAISEFVRRSSAELMSVIKPGEGRESIATVKKDDLVYLVRVYAV